MKKVLSLKTKTEVIFIVALLVSIGVSSVMSVTRTITDSSDTIDTYIRNSNGKYWSATETNLQLAFNDLNNQSGYVESLGQRRWTTDGKIFKTEQDLDALVERLSNKQIQSGL